MNSELVPFDAWALAFIGLYLSSLVVIGWIGYRARREHSMRDFYLAGPGIGFVVLLLTLYATQYSGNTLLTVALVIVSLLRSPSSKANWVGLLPFVTPSIVLPILLRIGEPACFCLCSPLF